MRVLAAVLLLSVGLMSVAIAQSPQWPGDQPSAQAVPAAVQSSTEFAPPPGPYGRSFGAFPAGYFPPWGGWGAPASGPQTMAPPPTQSGYYNPAEVPPYAAPQATPAWPPAASDSTANPGRNMSTPAASRPDTAFNPGGQQWPGQGYSYDSSSRSAAPSYAAPGFSQQPAAGSGSQWQQAPAAASRQGVIYPGITPVEAYAPQVAPVWPQAGYQPSVSNSSGSDQRGWPPPQGSYSYPESQAFPRR